MSLVRTAFEWLPEQVRKDIVRRRAEFRGIGQLAVNQRLFALRLAELEGNRALGTTVPEVPDHRFPDGVRSRLCTHAQFSQPWFTKWCEAIRERPAVHMKNWEFGYVAETLDRLGLLEPGRRAVGFGVGREPLISAFADRGVEVVATDLEPDSREALGWVRSDQHAHGGVDDMLRDGACDPAKFRELVSWRGVDMRAIPDDVCGFDFCWSICSLEHLGTLAAGLDFIENSLKTLVPGGIAVHTTAFNVHSNEDTLETGPTVAYRERDLLEFRDRLEAQGHEVAAFDLSRGDGLFDRYIDVPPYGEEPGVRFLFASYTLSSVAIVVRAKSAP